MNDRHGRRLIDRHGEAATLHYYDVDETTVDDHGDPTVTEQTVATTAIFEMPRATIREVFRATGTEREITPTIYLPDDVAEEAGATAPTTVPDVQRDPEVVRDRTGVRFRVTGSFDERNGVVRCEAEQVGFDS